MILSFFWGGVEYNIVENSFTRFLHQQNVTHVESYMLHDVVFDESKHMVTCAPVACLLVCLLFFCLPVCWARLFACSFVGWLAPCIGRSHWQRLGRLGQLHRISSSSVRERAGSAGPCGILGSGRSVRRWQRGELQAPSCYRNQARKDCHACNYGIYHPRDHGKVPWLLKPIGRPQVRGHPEWPCCHLQGSSGRMGTDPSVHGLLRGVADAGARHCGLRR